MDEIIGLKVLDEYIYNKKDSKNIILFFGASWCAPCKKLKNDILQILNDIQAKNISLCYIDVDNELNSKIVKKYKIKFLPTQICINLTQIIDNNDLNNEYLKININNRIDGYDYTKLTQIIDEM